MTTLVTLDEIKTWLGIKVTTDDTILNALNKGASTLVERYLNRNLLSQAYDEVIDGQGGHRLLFAQWPVTAVALLQIDSLTVPQVSDFLTPGYRFNETQLWLQGFYNFCKGRGNVRIQYTAGYSVIPDDIKQATWELVGIKFKERDRIGLVSKGLAGETTTYSQKDMPASVSLILDQYKKVIWP